MTEDRTALLSHPTRRRDEPHMPSVPHQATATAGEQHDQTSAPSKGRAAPGRRRWNDPDEKLMLWGAVCFLGLGLYAAAFILFGMWLTPMP